MSVANEGEVFGKAGKRSGGSTTPAIDDLLAASKQILSQAGGGGMGTSHSAAMQTALGQLSEGLTSGGIGARLPVAQRAVEATRSATSNALRGTDERLARTGLAGSPFGESIRSGVALQGAVKAADAPIQVTMQAIEQLLPLLLQENPQNALIRAGLAGMGQAAGAQAGVLGADTSALAAQKNNFWDNTASGMRMGMGGGAGASGGSGAYYNPNPRDTQGMNSYGGLNPYIA